MYYDDETRRFNLLSGLVFGLILGSGLAMLGVPQERVPPRVLRRGGTSRARRTGRRLERLGSELGDTMRERLAAVAARRGR